MNSITAKVGVLRGHQTKTGFLIDFNNNER